MGCGSSKAKTPTTESKDEPGDRPSSTAELKEAEESQSIGSIKSMTKNLRANGANSTSPEGEIPGNVPEPVAFEIPAMDEEDSIIKKHPPKRLQKLEDMQVTLTPEQLIEKQQEAEERRQKILNERVMSSRRSAHHRRRAVTDNDRNDQIEEAEVEGHAEEEPKPDEEIQEL